MELLNNRYTLELSPGAFPLSTDTIALSGFVKLPRNAKVLDLGAGCGTLGLLLCAQDESCAVTGIELDSAAHEMALQNAQANSLTSRLTSICANFADVPKHFKQGSFSCCVSNPPYFSSGAVSKAHPDARSELQCSLETVFDAAAWAVKYGGDFFLVHRPERLAEVFACGKQRSFEPKRLCLLRHKTDGPVALTLIQFRKGAKPGLSWEEVALHNADGTPTDYHKKLYHI